jgi:hypothetical protein
MKKTLKILKENQLLTIRKRMDQAHAGLDTQQHLKILFGDIKIGKSNFLDLYTKCIKESRLTVDSQGKFYNRPMKALSLIRYLEYAQSSYKHGPWVECGVYFGFSSLLACYTLKEFDKKFTGKGFYMVDSFEGISKHSTKDMIPDIVPEEGGFKMVYAKDRFEAPFEEVKKNMSGFPNIEMVKGWIPDAFEKLPDMQWSFVNIDVDMYEPTYASMEYFYPRLLPGGVMICDDYITAMFPGARKAWDKFCTEHEIPFAILDSGQSVFIKN